MITTHTTGIKKSTASAKSRRSRHRLRKLSVNAVQSEPREIDRSRVMADIVEGSGVRVEESGLISDPVFFSRIGKVLKDRLQIVIIGVDFVNARSLITDQKRQPSVEIVR